MGKAAALDAIWEQSRDEILTQVDVVAAAITDALVGSLEDEARAGAAREAHKLAGSVGTLGFALASERARKLEHALGGHDGPPPSDLPRLAELVVALRGELESDREAAVAPSHDADAGRPVAVMFVEGNRARAAALLADARARDVHGVLATDLESARRTLADSAPEVVVLDLAIEPGVEEAMQFLSLASLTRPVMVINDGRVDVDRVEVARMGGRGFLAGSQDPPEILTAALELRERVRVRGTRILAVDDDAIFLDALEVVLGGAGLSVETCQGPIGFWDRLEQVSPDLVVLDFDMPSVSGVELCRALRNEPRWAGLPVVFLTSRTDAESVRAVFDAGADDYLTKPFVGPEVTARIGNRLERVRLYNALAETDALTGLANRRKSAQALEALLSMAARRNQPASVAAIDVDSFKSINDGHGHEGGDAVLRELGAMLLQFFRAEDVVGRWGGDELLVGMYGMTSADSRERLGEFVEKVRAHPFHQGRIRVTLSIGVAEYDVDGANANELYRSADAALYVAKSEGRDRVVPAGRVSEPGPETVDVVIVEDDNVLGELLRHALEARGYRTRWINDGRVAADELGAAAPGVAAPLLLLDWDLPGLDGLRVLGALRERGVLERTRVIMLTARGTEDEVLQALEAGAVDHVAKPFSVPVLMQRVRRAMER